MNRRRQILEIQELSRCISNNLVIRVSAQTHGWCIVDRGKNIKVQMILPFEVKEGIRVLFFY